VERFLLACATPIIKLVPVIDESQTIADVFSDKELNPHMLISSPPILIPGPPPSPLVLTALISLYLVEVFKK